MEPSMKEEILAQLRQESAAQLEEHKLTLEREYQQRLEGFMSQFSPPPNRSGGNPDKTAGGGSPDKTKVVARIEDATIAARRIVKLGGQKGAHIVLPKEADEATGAAAVEARSSTKKAKQVAEVLPEHTVKTYITTPLKQEEVGADPLRNKSQALALTGDWLSPVNALPRKQTGGHASATKSSPRGSDSKPKSRAKQQPAAGFLHTGGAKSPLELAEKIASNDFPLAEQEQLLDKKMNNVTKYLLHKTEFLLKGVAEATTSPLPKDKTRRKNRRQGRPIEDVIFDALMKEEEEAAAVGCGEGGGSLPDVFASPAHTLRSPVATLRGTGRLPLLGTKGGTQQQRQRQQHEEEEEGEAEEEEEQPPRPPQHLKPAIRYANPLMQDGHYTKVNDVEHGDLQHAMPAHAWHNDVARHILSVFASQKTKHTSQPQHKVMQYVDPQRQETLETVKQHLDAGSADIHSIVAEFDSASMQSATAKRRALDDESSVGTLNTAGTKGTRATAGTRRSAAGRGGSNVHSLSDAEAAQKYITDMAKASKFRKTQMVKAPFVEASAEESTAAGFRWRSKHLRRGVDIALRSSPNVVPIWFVSTGELDSNWSVLPGGAGLQGQLNVMYENKSYMEYLCVLESVILKMWAEATQPPEPRRGGAGSPSRASPYRASRGKSRSPSPHSKGRPMQEEEGDDSEHLMTSATDMWDYEIGKPVDVFAARAGVPGGAAKTLRAFSREEVSQLWKKFIITANAMVLLCCEGKWFDKAIDLLTRLEEWSSREDMLPQPFRTEVRAYLYDSFSYFFYRKKKNRSALNNSLKSLAIYERANNVEYISIVLLHICCVHVQNKEYKEAHRVVQEFLLMVNDGRLSSADTTPKMLCLASIGYHNLAVVQLKMDVPDLAAKSSQSARKIAKLCLSYSNRWLASFERTHECAVEEIKFQMAANHGLEHRVIQVSDPLITELFSPNLDLSSYHEHAEKA